jgi:hypothetical protein
MDGLESCAWACLYCMATDALFPFYNIVRLLWLPAVYMFALRSSNTLGMYACRWEPMICAAMFSLLLQRGKSYRPPGQQPAVGVPGYEQGRCTLRLWWWRANQSQVSALRTLGACMEDKRLQRKHKLRNVGRQQERPPRPPFISIPGRPSARHSRTWQSRRGAAS